jgi:hypothetical protein
MPVAMKSPSFEFSALKQWDYAIILSKIKLRIVLQIEAFANLVSVETILNPSGHLCT